MNNLQRKKTIVEELGKKLDNNHFYITNSEGLNVQQVTEIRRLCHEKNIHYQVVKNTLLERAFALLSDQAIDYLQVTKQALKGSSACFIAPQDIASEPAKIIQKFQKDHKIKKPFLKGAVVNGEIYIGPSHLKTLSSIKTKEALLAELISLLQSPVRRVIRALKSPQNKLSSIMKVLPKEDR